MFLIKKNVKRILSVVISLSVVFSMFTIPVTHAAVTGKTEEILSFDFEDGLLTPSFIYGNATHSTEGYQAQFASIKNDTQNQIANKCWTIDLSNYPSGNTHLFINGDSNFAGSLSDIGGGSFVVSWDMAAEIGSEAEPQVSVYFKTASKSKSRIQQFKFYYKNGKKHVQADVGKKTGDYRYKELGSMTDGWHTYDLVFKYGTYEIELYEDGVSIYKNTSYSTLGKEGWLGSDYYYIKGIDDSDRMFQFGMNGKSDTTAPKAYYDNIKLRRYNSSETFIPKFNDNLNKATDNSVSASGTTLNRQECDFKVVTGMFGKAQTDKSFKIVKSSNATEGIKNNYYQKSNYGTAFQSGGKFHLGFNIAMAGDGTEFSKYLCVKPTNGTEQEILNITKTGLTCPSTSIPITWETERWYKFDAYITPGNGSTKNKMALYLNGEKVLENIELADTSFSGLDYLRLGQKENLLSGGNNLYIDDVSLDYIPDGINPDYPEINITSNNSDIEIADYGTIYVYDNTTVGDVMDAISADVPVYAVSDMGTLAEESANASDNYLFVRASSEIGYLFTIENIGIKEDEVIHKISELETIDYIRSNTYILDKDIWGVNSKATAHIKTGNVVVENQGYITTKTIEFDKNFMVDVEMTVSESSGYAELLLQNRASKTGGNKTVIARVYSDKVIYLPEYDNIEENFTTGYITAVVKPDERKVYVYQNDVLKVASDIAIEDIDFDSASVSIISKDAEFSCDRLVISADSSINSDFMVFAPRFKYDGGANILSEAIVFNNSKEEQNVDLFLAIYMNSEFNDVNSYTENLIAVNGLKHISGSETKNKIFDNKTLSLLLWEKSKANPLLEKISFGDVEKVYEKPSIPTNEGIIKNLNRSHPRLLVTDFDALKSSIDSSSVREKWFETVKADADSACRASIPQYEDSDTTRISSAANFQERIMLMAFAYNVTKDQKYATRIWEYLEAAEQWPDWGYGHFFDTADIMMAYAFAYDWLYSYWNDEQKAFIKDTLVEKGLEYAYGSYNGDEYTYWLDYENNWTTKCNAAVLVSALAVADEETIAPNVIRCALENIQNCYSCFEPDGAWEEGTGYGELALKFLAIALASSETSLGSDFGHRYAEGLSATGFYNLYMYGRNGFVGLNDNTGSNEPYQIFYFANLYQDKYLGGFRYYQLQTLKLTPTMYDLIWYNNKNVSLSFQRDMPFDKYYQNIQTVLMRDGFFANTNAFAALHAGYNNVSHGHLDGGSFEYETNGIRWALDLGSDNYNLFNWAQKHEYVEKNRWCYYRHRAEGHNTWVINPDSLSDQKVEGEGEVTKYNLDNSGTSWAVANLKGFYSDKVTAMNRGLKLDKTNDSLIVRDEINLKNQSELYWFMHTKAAVTISDDKKSAILSQRDDKGTERRLWVGITDGNGEFEIMSAKPLSTSPNPDEWNENTRNSLTQNPNDGVQKLAVHYTNATTVNQTVYMVELTSGQTRPTTVPENISLADWRE